MRHQRVEAWEESLNELLKRVDRTLETEFGNTLRRHPARPPRGATANPQSDGLFRVTASFTPGFGSAYGRGYVIQVDIVTLDTVSAAGRKAVEDRAIQLVRKGIESALPGRGLTVKRDGSLWKLLGDLSLDHPPQETK